MIKSDLIAALSQETSLSRKDTEKFIDAFLATIAKTLKNKDTISFKGFGTFSTTQRSARTGRNPRTKEEIKIPASTAPKFTPSKVLKELLNK